MPFTVHAAETQAMQEDQAQLLNAIAHTTRVVVSYLHKSKLQTKPESPQIYMNGRMIYGGMANGQIRNELTAERLREILDGLQRPTTDGIDLKRYKGKTAEIEIRDAGMILFRQEKDSVITVNQFQHQLQREAHSKQTPEIEMS